MTATRTGPSPTPHPPVDPRIRARRIEVRRREGRRRLRWVLAALGATVLVAGAWALSRSPLLDVDRVVVVGAGRTGVEAVLAAADVAVGDQLLDVDLPTVRSAVAELPWVAEVSARRVLPGTVRLQVTERLPVAVVVGDGRAVLVDEAGHALGPPDPAELAGRGVPRIESLVVPEPGAVVDPGDRRAVDTAAGLRPGLAAQVDAVVRRDDEVVLRLLDGGEVRLGDATGLEEQLDAATTVLARVDLTCLAVIDVRVPSAPAVTRRSLTEDPACP